MRRMVPQICQVEAVVCASEHEAAWLERNLMEHSKPRWNRVRGGLEVPVHLRLDPGPRAPSLTLVHDVTGPLPHFGPYLGGTRVRTALTALASVHPVAHSGEGLVGSARAMADARGVTPGHRPGLVAALTAVLGRDEDAVEQAHQVLAGRRDRAAADLDFQQAARVQEQIEALAWLVSPQRVTASTGGDARVAGWSDGILVEFGIVAGRLSTWSARAASRGEAATRLAATGLAGTGLAGTGAALQDFAQVNAELAARLRAGHRG
jgi:excinuclease ABC subunit C